MPQNTTSWYHRIYSIYSLPKQKGCFKTKRVKLCSVLHKMYTVGKLPHDSNITQCFKYDKKKTSKTQIIVWILTP